MNDNSSIRQWFPDPICDEAVFAMHLFLEQFTLQFEMEYYTQIRRYIESQRRYFEDQRPWEYRQLSLAWEDESIDF